MKITDQHGADRSCQDAIKSFDSGGMFGIDNKEDAEKFIKGLHDEYLPNAKWPYGTDLEKISDLENEVIPKGAKGYTIGCLDDPANKRHIYALVIEFAVSPHGHMQTKICFAPESYLDIAHRDTNE